MTQRDHLSLFLSLDRLGLSSGEFAYLRALVVFASDFPGLPDPQSIASLRKRALRELYERLQKARYEFVYQDYFCFVYLFV